MSEKAGFQATAASDRISSRSELERFDVFSPTTPPSQPCRIFPAIHWRMSSPVTAATASEPNDSGRPRPMRNPSIFLGEQLMEHPTPQASLEAPGLPATRDREPGPKRAQLTAPCLPLRVLFVSDVRFLRESLAEILYQQSELSIAWVAEDQNQALELVLAVHPDAVLLDTALPSGIDAVASLVAAAPDIPVIALAMVEAEHEILTWAEAGIAGFVPRSASISDTIRTVSLAVRGEQNCSARVAGSMIRRLRQLALLAREQRHGPVVGRLTAREHEIAELVAQGLSNKLIARRLHISVATVKCHMHNMLDKLKLQRRGNVALWIRQQLTRVVSIAMEIVAVDAVTLMPTEYLL
jgi:two-component system, NarL family, nitrate/nitrite response regulator NarL